MPSTSAKQHRFFEWIDHTPGAAKKAGVPKSVAHDFVQADIGKKFAQGGAVDAGLDTPGNIDPFNRTPLQNPDGSVSTTLSFSIPTPDGREVLLPQVVNGVKLSRPAAIARYRKTGEHLGIFNDWRSADGYAQQLHNEQARRMGLPVTSPTAPVGQTFAGAPMPAVGKLLKAASLLHDQSEKLRKGALRGATEAKPKGYAEGGAVTKEPQPKPKKGDKDRPVDAGDFLGKLSEGFVSGAGKMVREGMDTPEAILGALRHPIRTGQALYQGAVDLKNRAASFYDQAFHHPLDTAGSMVAGLGRRIASNVGTAMATARDPKALGEAAMAAAPMLINPVEAGPERALAGAARELTHKEIESHFVSKLANHEAAKAEYAALNIPGTAETDGGRILSVDSARELSPHYQADRSKSAAVHEPGSDFIKQLYAERLAQPAAPGKVESVLFTAGGTGAGKTSAIKKVPFVQRISDQAHTVYDTNMGNIASARKKIEQALAAGKDVDIAYVYRDPVEAFQNGTLSRAERIGRTVPMDAHAETHRDSFETVRQLQAEYMNHPDVRFHIIDNSLGAGNQRLTSFDQLLGKRYNIPIEDLHDVLQKNYAAGKISDRTFAGTLGSYPGTAGGARQVPRGAGAVAGDEPAGGNLAQARAANPSGVDLQASNGRSVTMQLADAFDNALGQHYSLDPAARARNSAQAAEAVGSQFGRLKNGQPRPLLTMNGKLAKANTAGPGGAQLELPGGQGIESYGLALSPAYSEGKFTTCPNSASCKALCLGKTSGGYAAYGGGKDLTMFKGPRLTSLQRTKALLNDPGSFAVRLSDEIDALKAKAAANGNQLGVRLNVLSDINPRVHKALIEAHPDVQFYDYTKNNSKPIAANHHYTYSSTGVTQPAGMNGIEADAINRNQNWSGRAGMRARLDGGDNVAMGFSSKKHLPDHVIDQETGNRYQVIDGDTHDFRPLDKQPEGSPGVIVGLRNKNRIEPEAGSAVRSNGFFVHYDPKVDKVTKQPTNPVVVIPTQGRAAPILTNDLTVDPTQ